MVSKSSNITSFSGRPIYGLILAGGFGTRLWPLSCRLRPKYLLALNSKRTLLQETAFRLLSKLSPNQIVTVTHAAHEFEVRYQLQEIHPALTDRILVEPESRNTLPAIAWAVATIAQEAPEALVTVFPSDHAIHGDAAFQEAVERASTAAHREYLVTLGIKPTGPETGYGYLLAGSTLDHQDVFEAVRFVEKPDRTEATELLSNGNCFWNSGIFAFSVSTFQRELKTSEPEIFERISRIVSSKDPETLKNEYRQMKPISIDYGLMEKSKKVAVVPAKFGWSDLGNWEAIYQALEKDPDHNAVQGSVRSEDTHSSLLISRKGSLATVGLKDMIVVRAGDDVLVCPRDRAQEVKKISECPPEAAANATSRRPWGQYTVIEEGPGYKIKRIIVDSRQKLSLQRHRHRAEHWIVIQGTARVTAGARQYTLEANESTFIPVGQEHRLENPGAKPLVIIEVQTGDYVGEDDIERLEDIYGRTVLR